MRTSCKSHRLQKLHVRILFAERVINVWNSLPPVVDFSSLTCFKRAIMNVDFTEFLNAKCIALYLYLLLCDLGLKGNC